MLAQVLAHNSTSTTTPTFHVDSKLVVLDVVVTDAKGNIVPGLKREDFTVLQDNISMPIRTFESWTDRKPLPEVPALDRFNRPDWGETPLTIFVLDELNTPFDEKTYSAVQLKKYLKAQPVLLAGPATLIVVNDYGYHSLQDYTRNRDLLIARLDARPPAIPSKLTIGENDLLLRQSFALLRQIAISSQGLREHKNLVWIGRGFPSLDPTGLTDASQASLQNAIRNTVSLLQDARVTVYKVDPMATTTQLTTVDQAATLDVTDGAIGDTGDQQAAGEDPFAQNFNFNTFAVATGGHYFYGLNDLNRFIDTSVQQGTEFYTLSYRPPPATVDGTFLNIKIMMIPPGLTAQTRQGYYASLAAKPEPTSDELGFDLGQAAVSQMEYAGVNASVSSIEPSKVPGRLRVTFKIEDRTLQWSPATNGRVSDFTTVLVALDAKHQIVSSNAYKMHPFMVDSDSALLTTGLLTVADDVRIDPKTRFVRVLVRDSSGRIGSADVDGVQLQAAMAKIVLPSEKRFGRH
ncbi:MAG: VWA domain-containing protein [Acidobacteriaceae bacterium]|nr:VWA domain-containing protein [Acidobacteriaceae bacterium]